MEIEKKRVLVTGGAGNIGSHIVDRLVKEGAEEVIVLDNFFRGRNENLMIARKNGNIKVVNGDIRDSRLVNELCRNVDYVFHQAAIRITQCAKEPRLCHEILVDGTYNVFEACVKNSIRKLIFASSASVYGEHSYLPMDEGHPFNNCSNYGAGKIFNENLAKSFRYIFGLNYIGLRYFNVYGPRMDAFGAYTEVMIRFLDRIDEGQPPVIYGDGKQSMDFVYVEDVAKANILALKNERNEGIYNVGTGNETDLNRLYSIMAQFTKHELEPEYKKSEQLIPASRRRAATQKAEKELGFKAEVSLEEGLKKLIEWRTKEKESMSMKE
jgi:UDP-glucose 4-epimerase